MVGCWILIAQSPGGVFDDELLLLRLPPSPVIWLSESWGRIGRAIDRTETESSAVLLCRAGHTVRQFNRCRAQGQPPLSALPKHTFAPLLPFWPCAMHVSLYDCLGWNCCRFIQLLTTNWFIVAAKLKPPWVLVQVRKIYYYKQELHII